MYSAWQVVIIEIFRITFTANGRNDHVTMFTVQLNVYMWFTILSFSVKLSSFSFFIL